MKTIIAEKEEAAKRIAEILIPNFETIDDGITYFTKGKTIIVPARGHVVGYTIRGLRTAKRLEDLPKMEIEPSIQKSDKARFELIKKLLNESDDFIVATDWDREGEVIGYNLVKYSLGIENPMDIPRAYYSALREEDIIRSFRRVNKMNESLLTQGLARNYADLIIGLNLTKALTIVFKKKHKTLGQAISLGRVQSPLLGYINDFVKVQVEENNERMKNKSEDISMFIDLGNGTFYKIPNIDIIDDCLEVLGLEEIQQEIPQAESLFNTDDMMSVTKLNPTSTMEIMESLYLKGFMTYPRTTSRYVRDVSFLKEIEDAIRKYKNLPETFSYMNTPRHRIEEAHPDAILLTPEGIDAYFNDKFKGREKFVAEIVLMQTIRSFAPPLRRLKRRLKIRYLNPKLEAVESKIDWGEKYENIDDAIKYVREDTLPVPKPGRYRILKLKEIRDTLITTGKFKFYPNTLTDIDLVRWMAEKEIGTEATRQIFPSLLRDSRHNYVDESNLPTILGSVVGHIITDKVGLTPQLTMVMEDHINKLEKLDQLPNFLDEIKQWTEDFITKLRDIEAPTFTCPNGHEATLVNRFNKMTNSVVLLLQCKQCNKYYGV